MYHSFRVLIFCLFISFPLALRGQGTGDSPFSQFGVGDINNSGNMRNMGMGNAGVSSRSHHFVNFLNPALLPNLRSPKKSRPNHTYKMWEYYRNLKLDSTVKIDFAVNFQDKSIQAPRGANENTSGMNVAYLTFALPISKTWATAFGIVPYSIVNYNLTYNNVLPNNPTVTNTVQNSTKGGIYKVFVSNGLGITQNLSVGLETAFLYGNVNDELFSLLPDLTTSSFGFKRQTVYRSFELKPGLQFRKEIVKAYHDTIYEEDSMGNKTIPVRTRKTKSSGVFYNIGLTYDFYSALNITRNLDLYVVNNVNTITLDSLVQTNKYKAKLPSTLRFGFSLDAPLKWTIAADVFYSPWSNYKTGFSTDTLGNSYGLNIGGEFCPNSTKQKSKTFRAGFSYVKTPVIYRGYQLDDMSISFGASIPLGRNRRPNAEQYMMPVRPKLNFALVVGQRGNVNTFGIKEQYVKLYASFLINQKWFNKSKIY